MNLRRISLRFASLPLSAAALLVGAITLAQEPLMINQIAVHPKSPKVLYAAARPQGVLKSVDRGESWVPARKGLKNTSVYYLVIPERDPGILYLATFGGGVYRSTDEGENWIEINNGLGNTNIHALAVHPTHAKTVVVGTSTGELFESQDGGGHWEGFSQGLPEIPGEVVVSLLFIPKGSPQLYLGQESLYVRGLKGSTPAWLSQGKALREETITSLAFDPEHQVLYAGTMRNGVYTSTDRGKSWVSAGAVFEKKWIHKVYVGGAGSNRLFVSVLGEGLYRSEDGAKSWERLHRGLPRGENILSLAFDPIDFNRLYAGTHNQGIFLSSDGGSSWTSPKIVQEPLDQIVRSLQSPSPNSSSSPPSKALPSVPDAFTKCTRCHGWSDPLLSQKKTFWQVPPNPRDWAPTVNRMKSGAGLTDEEEVIIVDFLNRYSRQRAATRSP